MIFTGLLVWLFFSLCVETFGGETENKHLQQYDAYTDSLIGAFSKGNNYKARAYASKALIAASQGKLEYQTALAYSNLSVVNGRMGDLEAANDFNFKALRIFTKLNDTLQIARCNLSIGSVHISLKEYDKALSYITKARDAFYRQGDMLGYSICLTNLGSIYTSRGEYGKALPDFYEALSIDEKNNDSSGMTSNYISIGKIYEKLDNDVQAKEFFEKAYSLAEVSDNKSGLGSALGYLAMLKMNEGKPNEALILAKRSLDIREDIGELQGKRFTLELLSEIYQKLGDNNRSLLTFKEATSIKDSIFNLDKAARIATLEEKFINERLINENLSLKFVNEIHNTRITAQRRITFSVIAGLITAILAIIIITVQLRKKNTAYKFLVEKNLKFLNQEAELYKLRMKLEGASGSKASDADHSGESFSETEVAEDNGVPRASDESGVTEDEGVPTASDESGEYEDTGSYGKPSDNSAYDAESELEKSRTINLSPEEQKRLLGKLEKLMGTEKIFTRTDLTIDRLARRLSTNRTYLSQLINEVYGKNYSDFINMYRVNEAMRLLADPVMGSKYSIEAISREAGFNTTSTFNSVFRKTIGITPSIFRKNATSALSDAENNTYNFTNSASF